MTHPNESTPLELMIQALDTHGFDGMAHAIQIFINEAMKIERKGESKRAGLKLGFWIDTARASLQ